MLPRKVNEILCRNKKGTGTNGNAKPKYVGSAPKVFSEKSSSEIQARGCRGGVGTCQGLFEAGPDILPKFESLSKNKERGQSEKSYVYNRWACTGKSFQSINQFPLEFAGIYRRRCKGTMCNANSARFPKIIPVSSAPESTSVTHLRPTPSMTAPFHLCIRGAHLSITEFRARRDFT